MSSDNLELERLFVILQFFVVGGERDPCLSDARVDTNDLGENLDSFCEFSDSVMRVGFAKENFDFRRRIQISNGSSSLRQQTQRQYGVRAAREKVRTLRLTAVSPNGSSIPSSSSSIVRS